MTAAGPPRTQHGRGVQARDGVEGAQIAGKPVRLVIGCMAFAVVVSILASLYPAARAAGLNPVDSLRYE